MGRTDLIRELVPELAERIPHSMLAKELGISEAVLKSPTLPPGADPEAVVRRAIRTANKYGFFDLLPRHGLTPVTYDIRQQFDLRAPPIGYDQPPPLLPLREDRRIIAGLPVDFPLGLPASVLAANAKWIEFYARRGFDILTYKTVRTVVREAHSWPNWVFIQNPVEIRSQIDHRVVGSPGYWPDDLTTATMANSFGIPSFAPEWWEEDIRRARDVVLEGHQILIVSIVSSIEPDGMDGGQPDAAIRIITDDFINAAKRAKNAGADIIEANYSCPNVLNDRAGYLYQDPSGSARVSAELKGILGRTPLFVKIGYLSAQQLHDFVYANAPHIDGVVAINTISAEVVDADGKETFPGRPCAGISGWAIKAKAQEVARNLVALRKEIQSQTGKGLAILGLGGVLTEDHVREYLDIGVDAVESCTGAFLDPYLGLKVRFDEAATSSLGRRALFELKSFGRFVQDVIAHPTKPLRW